MEVRYTLTLDEYVKFSIHVYWKSGVGRGWFFFSWLMLPLLGIGSAIALLQATTPAPVPAVLLLFLTACYTALFPFVYWSMVESSVRRFAEKAGTHGITGPITLILSEESFTEITATTRSEVKWVNMQGIEEVDDRTYIYVTGASAAVLPRSGFEADEDYEAARDFAMRKLIDRVRR